MAQPQVPGSHSGEGNVSGENGAGSGFAGVATAGGVGIRQPVEDGGKLRPGQGAVCLEQAHAAVDHPGLNEGGGGTLGLPGEVGRVGELIQHRQVRVCGAHLEGPAKEAEGLPAGDGLFQGPHGAFIQKAGVDCLGYIICVPGAGGNIKGRGIPLAAHMEHPAQNGHRLGSGNAPVRRHGLGVVPLQNPVVIGLTQGFLGPVAFHVGKILVGGGRRGHRPQSQDHAQKQGDPLPQKFFHLFVSSQRRSAPAAAPPEANRR